MSTSDTSGELFFEISAWANDIIVILISTLFCISYYKVKRKNYSLYMIFILNISNLILPFANILAMSLKWGNGEGNVMIAITVGTYQFGLFWSTTLSIFIYLALKYQRPFNPMQFIVIAFVICALLSSISIMM